MKVLWFTDIMMPAFCEKLGVQKSVINGWIPSLAEAVKKYAPQIELCIASEGPCRAEARIDGIKYVALGAAKRSGRFFPWLRRIRPQFVTEVRKCVMSFMPDVIHIHGSEGLFPTLPASCWDGIPCAISLQGIIAGYAPHYMGNLAERELRPFRNLVREVLQGYSTANAAAYWRDRRGPREAEALRRFRYVFGRTAWDRAWAQYLNPDISYFSVGEVLRPEFYCGMRKEEDVVPHTIYCGAAATYPLKGAHWLLRAVAALKRKYPDVKLTIAKASTLAGSPGFLQTRRLGEYQRYLRSLIEDLGLWENVELLGSLSAGEVVRVLRKSEVFCLPSLIENSPNSLGEAMLLGVPSIATSVGGIKSILSDGREGQLVSCGDPAVLADAIDRFFADRTFARTCADTAYETAVKRYAPDCVAQQLLNAYEAMVPHLKRMPLHV